MHQGAYSLLSATKTLGGRHRNRKTLPELDRLFTDRSNVREWVGMPGQSDRELVESTLRGCCPAFGKLVDRYHNAVFNLALKVVKDHDDAKDVVQTVFIKAYQKLKTFQPELEFSRWIFKIAVNESINLVDKRKNCAELGHDFVSSDKSPEEIYQRTELADRVQDAMMRMAIAPRALIVLRYFADMSYRELSYVFEAPEKTIKSRLHYARRALSKILASRGLAVND